MTRINACNAGDASGNALPVECVIVRPDQSLDALICD
jgi:hypothetical protein